MTEEYAVYPGADTERDAVPMPERWRVLIEYSNPSTNGPSTLVHVVDQDFDNRAEALLEAERRAFEFDPPEPVMPQGREVYADGEGFLTAVAGMVTVFHFSTRVVRPLTGATGFDDTASVADQAFLDRAAEDGAVI